MMVSAEDLAEILLSNGLTLSAAESCTGGLFGSAVTSVPGSSVYFLGGVVAYSNESKMRMLKVPGLTISEHGAVSGETAMSMASGVRELFDSDVSVSITGIAGPDGATCEKPVGLVYIGISSEGGAFARKFNFKGDRGEVRSSAVEAAIGLLALSVHENYP